MKMSTRMSRPFDATTRNLIEMNPAEWSAYLGHPVADPGRARLVDSNLSTITAEVDRVIRLEEPVPWLWNVEFQTGRDLDLAARLHFYSTLLHHHHKLPVRTSLILLRRAADGPELTGIHEMQYPGGEIYDWFRYDVVKLWEQPVEPILAAGLTVLPLAPVARLNGMRYRTCWRPSPSVSSGDHPRPGGDLVECDGISDGAALSERRDRVVPSRSPNHAVRWSLD